MPSFTLPTDLWFSNLGGTAPVISLDPGDGQGWRTLAPGDTVSATYPTAGEKELQVRLDGAGNGADVELTNSMGTVLRRTTISGSTPVLFEISSLPSGIYLLHSKAEGQAAQVQKVIIQH